MERPAVSIVVPAKNEAAVIGRTLDAVAAQMDPSRHELIVVDSASEDATGEIAAALGARVIRLDRPGQLIAKRAGAKAAKGRIIAMLDADCVVQPGWLRAVEAAFAANPEAAAATRCYGYDAAMPAWGRAWLAASAGLMVHPRRLLGLSQAFVRGGNVAFRREALGPDAYPPDGGIADTEVSLGRVLRRSGPILWVDAMRVVSDSRRFSQSPWRFFADYQWGLYLWPMIRRQIRGRG